MTRRPGAARFEVITFDCYGTLIDWEAGLLAGLRPILKAHGRKADDESLLRRYARIERRLERRWRPYWQVLEGAVRNLGKELRFKPSPAECSLLPAAAGAWKPFPDTVAALRRLKRRYGLAVISNVDQHIFERTSALLGHPFDWVITAEEARAYKPSPKPFKLALARIGLPPGRILHAAQSRFHDIGVAKSLGLGTVWVDRRGGRAGGAAPAAAFKPDWRVRDLKSLADLLR